MLEVTLAGWAATVGLIAALFLLDLFVTRPGHAHSVGFREAVLASLFYVGVAIAFGVVFGIIAGWDSGAEYFAGYIVEKSLSVDNLFVFVVIMATFAVPAEHQQRVLTFGILAALVMRAIFIALGAALISAFSFMFLIFGVLLIMTAIQLFRHRDHDPEIEDNALVRLTRRVLPITQEYDGGRLLTRVDGRRAATPLFVVVVALGSTDILFALDSIPAVFGVTEEPFIVFAANAFALRLHRREAGPALRPPSGSEHPRDTDLHVVGRDPGRARRHRRRVDRARATRPRRASARRLAPRYAG
jgi:tellurite resistance protein TerC